MKETWQQLAMVRNVKAKNKTAAATNSNDYKVNSISNQTI
jgi:hypothetical protein